MASWKIPKEWEQQTCVIFGGGPSLNQADVDYAIARGFRRVACNDAGLVLDTQADVLVWADARWWNWHYRDIVAHTGTYKICWRTPQPAPAKGVVIHQLRHAAAPPFLSLDPGAIAANNTGQGAINLAFLFGASRILLLGYDMKMVNGQHNWHTRHKRGTDHKRYQDVFAKGITKAAEILKKQNVEVLNCTKDSALTCFPFADLRDIP